MDDNKGFNLNRFDNAKFVRRTGEVPVISEAIKSFFDDGIDPVFKVQCLTGTEIAQCRNAPKTAEKLRLAMEAIESYTTGQKTDLKEGMSTLLLGDRDLPESLVISIETVTLGLVFPKLDHQQSVKLHKVSGVDAQNLFNKIMILSGKGFSLGESQPSGGGETSE